MAAIADLTLADGQASPANHVFYATPTDRFGVSRFYDRASGVPILYPRIEFAVYPSKDPTPSMKGARIDALAAKVNVKVFVPVPDVLGTSNVAGYEPAPSLAYNCMFNGTFTLPARSNLASRKDVIAYVVGALQSSMMSEAVHNLEGVFG
jgi:hypothetical protein